MSFKIILTFLVLLLLICIVYIYKFLEKNKNRNITKLPNVSSVVLIGTARDIEGFLPTTFKNIQMICDCFKKSNIIIYENDSKDKTLELLQNWSLTKKNVNIISEKNVPGLRTHRLSHGRNIIMDKALALKSDYIVVMDLDNVNDKLTKDAFLSSFKFPNLDWAVMTANQYKKFYDVWALRTYDDWMPFDYVECIIEKNDLNYCHRNRVKHIDKNKELISVKSAFSGLGIYKTKYIEKCKYYGGSGTKEICEHVPFNECIIKNGGKIYINPKMINSNGTL